MWLLRISKHYIINNQGRSQTSEQDEAHLERRRREPLDSGGMPPRENFEIQRLRNALLTDPIFSREMKIAAQKAALQNLRLQINNKTGQEIALGQVFKGIVEGRKFPKYDLCLGTDGYYANEMLLTAPCQR